MSLLTIETPDGPYRLQRAITSSPATARARRCARMVGAEFSGQVFEDQFLIADVKMTAAFPTERWFWFDPPFHAGRSALLHSQPDDVWRIDLQLGPDADPAVERLPENVRPRIARMLGHGEFEFEWISIYKFQCRRMQRFLHGRVIFAGDAAHQVSPFGARGANSGLEDAENLAWKLDRVLRGNVAARRCWRATTSSAARPPTRTSANRPARPISWRRNSHQEARLRKAVLSLAKETDFAKRMVNGGRLSVPSVYETPLSTADGDTWRGGPRPGASMADAPLQTASGEPMFLTDAFSARRNAVHAAANSATALRSKLPEGVGAIRIGGKDGLARFRRACSRSATTPSPARPICCAPTAMSRRASGIRPGRRSTPRWRAPPASTEVSSWRYRPASNFANPDDAFRAIVEAHRGLSDEQSAELDAALVLILANHIGDLDVLREAIALAKRRMMRCRASSSSNSSNNSRLERSQESN